MTLDVEKHEIPAIQPYESMCVNVYMDHATRKFKTQEIKTRTAVHTAVAAVRVPRVARPPRPAAGRVQT